MSVSDDLMWRYFDLLSFRAVGEVAAFRREIGEGRNPRDVKVLLAQEIVARFHGAAAAVDALSDFETRFRQGAIPEDVDDVVLTGDGQPMAIAEHCAGSQAGGTDLQHVGGLAHD